MQALINLIRAYVIRKLAEIVADDIIASGLTPADMAIIDEVLEERQTPATPAET